MDQAANDKEATSAFAFNPTGKVIGIIDDAGEAAAALRDLTAAGFTADEIELLTDEEGAQRIELPVTRAKCQFMSFAQPRNHRSTTMLPASSGRSSRS